ncbi:MAG: 1,4-alpha-glucan branching protein GlgB [Chlamydiae bacterium]|nr:1,4-alpha-glucan branching protein GlgB [Chlamydiota bacterium]
MKKKIIAGSSLFSEQDIYLFKEGSHYKLYDKLGSHLCKDGAFFAVWAPNAESVSVIGDFNQWNNKSHPLTVKKDSSGIWEGFISGVKQGNIYKYHIKSKVNDYVIDKGDPFAFFCEVAPKTASVVWDLSYQWKDEEWMKTRKQKNSLDSPISIYEVHLGSWKRRFEENARSLSYVEMADELVKYVKEMNFTHVEFLPVMEHPFFGSWGYQISGYFAPSSRYGTPQELMFLIDTLHLNGIGVILDWVPSHFPSDDFSLNFFDGTNLYEHQDPKKGFHPDWTSAIFNYDRNEVKEFLISSAFFWLEKYHADGIRIDAVSSMLYLDYSRKEGEWIPNKFGGRENLEAIDFIRTLNRAVYSSFPDIVTIAEESTSWPQVSRPDYTGGLGFGMKWNMGWMHDILKYFSKDPIYRRHHHNLLTFSLIYAFSENFMLMFSHDEVVYGKGSLFEKMPGDEWQKYANLRLLMGYLFAHPGKKLMFMGNEFGQRSEWQHDSSLDWQVLEYPIHRGLKKWVSSLNLFYKQHPALHEIDFSFDGFEWVDCNDYENSILSFKRKGKNNKELIVIGNFTPVPRDNYRIGVDKKGKYLEKLNSDGLEFGGTDFINQKEIKAEKVPMHGRAYSISVKLPPLGIIFIESKNET